MAITPQTFANMTREAAAQIDSLSDQGVRHAEDLLRQTQAELVLRVANAPSEYSDWYYQQMLASLGSVTDDLAQRYTSALESDLDRAASSVEDGIDRPLEQAGMIMSLPQVSRQTVEMLSGFSPGALIKGLTADAHTAITQQLQQTILGTKTPWEMQQALAKTLDQASIFGSIASRAEAIWRTESSRVYNTLSQERYTRIDAALPGKMEKQWLHSGNTRNPRIHHARLDGLTIPIHEKFLVGIYEADGPHDPGLPASETVRCGCTSILVFA